MTRPRLPHGPHRPGEPLTADGYTYDEYMRGNGWVKRGGTWSHPKYTTAKPPTPESLPNQSMYRQYAHDKVARGPVPVPVPVPVPMTAGAASPTPLKSAWEQWRQQRNQGGA